MVYKKVKKLGLVLNSFLMMFVLGFCSIWTKSIDKKAIAYIKDVIKFLF